MKISIRKRYSTLHLMYLVSMGVLGWFGIWYSLTHPEPFFRMGLPPMIPFVGALVLGLLSRILTFHIYENVRITIDSAFYSAAAFVLGVAPAALMIGINLTLDTLIRTTTSPKTETTEEVNPLFLFSQLLFNGGLPAIGFLITGALFNVDQGLGHSDIAIAIRITGFSLSFVVVHYFFAGITSWVQGDSITQVILKFFMPVVAFEATMLPLSIAMVLGFIHQGFHYFMLLGASYLLFNLLFRILADTTVKLRQRVRELVTLNRVGRIIASSLQREELISNLARYTLKLVGESSRFMIGLYNEKTRKVDFQLFGNDGVHLGQRSIAWGEGLSGWVMSHNEPLLLKDVQRQYRRYVRDDRYNDPRFHSWLGIPLSIYDEVIGVISVQAEQRNSYNDDELRTLGTIARQAAVAIQNAHLYEMATVDGLTKLYVRRYFDQRLEEEWQRSTRYENGFAVIIMDLDDFKKLNDTYGHQAGDRILRRAAQIAKQNLRGADIPARYGGEEFAFILPRTNIEEAEMVAQRIATDLASQEILNNNQVLKITASLGVAAYPESTPKDANDMVSKADIALYKAKAQGKNCVRVLVDPQHEESTLKISEH